MNNIVKKILLVTSVLMVFGTVFADAAYKTITAKELRVIQESKKRVYIFDALTPIHYRVAHIPRAANIPVGKILVGGKLNPRLPKNKDAHVVFYCMDFECLLSGINANDAIKEGFTNVSVMREGIVGWKAAGYPVQKSGLVLPKITPKTITTSELKSNLDNVYLVGLLSGVSAAGIIKGTVYVPIAELMMKYKQIPKNKNVVLYSIKGKTDKIAVKFLVAKGYDENKIKYLKGGVTQWIKDGYSVQ